MHQTIPYSNLTTSKAAARSVTETRPNLISRVFKAIRSRRGATCEEVELFLGAAHQSVSSAIRTLALAGQIFDSRRRRVTRTGREAIVWKVVRA